MARGVAAVPDYLQAEFPDHTVQVLEPSDRDHSRDTRTFKVRDEKTKHLLRVTDEVLNLDTDGVGGFMRAFRVAQVLREAGAGKAVLVTTEKIRMEPIAV